MTSAILIGLYLYSELTFDHFHQNHNQIYRLNATIGDFSAAMSGYETGSILVREYPQFLDSVRMRDAHEQRFQYGDNSNRWEFSMLADQSIFDVFTFRPLQGDMTTALDDPYSIAISESFARFYFADRNPVGELISTNDFEFRVTLVFEDFPENVSQRFDALLPMQLMEVYEPNYLDGFNRFLGDASTYLLVANSFDPGVITSISDQFFDTYMSDGFQNAVGNVGPLNFSIGIQKLSDIHFAEALLGDESTESSLNITLFSAVSVAVLLISCINYVNLATTRAALRTKEVAMRKILGANRTALIAQFVAESMLLISLALVISILLVLVASQFGVVEIISGKAELSDLLLSLPVLVAILSAGLMIGLLTGLYPAFSLSQPSMMAIFRPQRGGSRRGLRLRQLLVFVQVGITMVIIISVLIMLRQTDFLMNAPLGFKKDDQLVVKLQGADAIRGRAAVINELTSHSEIVSVVEGFNAIGRSLSISIMPIENQNGERIMTTTHPMRLGTNLIEALEIELLEGINFTEQRAENEINPVLVNETMVRELGWEQPIGRQLGSNEVVGVVADFHYMPLHQPIASVWIAPFADGYLDNLDPRQQANAEIALMISTTGNQIAETRRYIRETVDRLSDQSIIDIVTLNELWNENYEEDTRVTRLVAFFAGVSIVISLMGLAGLATYNNQQRSKEIAIRKVLGASTMNLLMSLTANTFQLILFAAVPATFAAYYLSALWLERFAYRIEWSFLPYFIGFLVIAIFSVSILWLQTLRTVQANPVENLRYE